MTKVAGLAASLAHAMGRIAPPLMALPSALTVGAVTVASLDSEMAMAGCTRSSPYSGDLHCTGQISGTIELDISGEDISVALDSSATVMIPDQESGGGSGDAIHLDHHQGTSVTQGAGGGAISGRRHGIYLRKQTGNGDVGVSVTGPVTGRSGDGVRISQRDTFGRNSLTTVSAGSVTGAASGIRIFKHGRGIVSITATGAVSGSGSSTLDAGISISATTAEDTLYDVTRSLEGVAITAATVTGAGAGILVENAGPTGWVNVTTTGSTTGDAYGIRVINQGSGGISLTVSDSVTGGSGAGHAAIATRTLASGTAAVTLLSGASIGAAGRVAVLDGDGSATVAIHSGASVTGTVRLGAGADRLVVAGGSFDGELDGGAGAHEDTLTFLSGSTAIDAASLTNWESVEVASTAAVLVDGQQTLAADTLVLSGTLGMADDLATDDVLTVDGDLAGGGTVSINADFGSGTADRLVIAGDLSGVTVVDVSRIGAADGRVEIASVSGNAESGALRVADGAYLIDFREAAGKFYLRTPTSCTAAGGGAFGCTKPIFDSQSLGASGTDALNVSIGASATFDVDPGHALSLTQDGVAGITLAQAVDGLEISGTLDGISAANTGGGSVSISTTGPITGGERGIFASSDSSGTGISISAAAAVAGGRGHAGIRAENAGSGDLSISAAAVSGGADGILAIGSGGDMTIAAGPVSSRERSGVFARNHGEGSLTISVASVTAARSGVDALNAHGGSLVIAARGYIAITGHEHSHPAIKAENRGSSTDSLMIDLRDVAGVRAGVHARNEGTGALSIAVSGSVTTFDSYGSESVAISAYNSANGGDLSIVQRNRTGAPASAIAVTAARNAIRATNKGSGTLSISIEGMIKANTALIDATNYGSSLSIAIGSGDSGIYNAVNARNLGTGMTSIAVAGTITGGHGIRARSWGSGLTISAASVRGSNDAIQAFHYGSGKLTVSASGSVSSGRGSGVFATNSGTGIEISMAETSGGTFGILASNHGAGMLRITATGSVTGRSGDGISAVSGPDGADLEIRAKGVFGSGTGIHAMQSGTGALEIAVAGETVGAARDGVFASGGAAAQGVTVRVRETGSVRGSATGIRAESPRGNLTISAAGSVSATHGVGVSATGSGGSLEISTVETSGGSFGILASNRGAGMLKITATGSVTGRSGDGISAVNGARGADLEIFSKGVFGSGTGIHATQSGTGALEIAVAGETVGAARDGVFASAGAAANGVTVNVRRAGSVRGSATGIRAESLRGSLAVTARGNVEAISGTGISAAAAGGDVTVQVSRIAAATGSAAGVHAVQRGAGRVDVAVFGRAVGRAGDGVLAKIAPGGSGAAVRVGGEGGVTGGASGIRVESADADLTVAADGPVTGRDAYGISALVAGGDGAIAISAASVAGSAAGIRALSSGTGRIAISATGVVVGNVGIAASASSTDGGGVAVSAAGVHGATDGIRADDAGRGSLSVKSTGAVVAASGTGIRASNSARGSSLTVSANTIWGAAGGIHAISRGSGTLKVTAQGAVTGAAGAGVLVRDTAAGAGISVTAAAVDGGARGIDAYAMGSGPLSVTTSGPVGSGAASAISAVHGGRGSVSVTTVSVTGYHHGIIARALEEEPVSVLASGHAIGETGSGIQARSGDREVAANAAASGLGASAAIHVAAGSATGRQHGIYAKKKGTGTLRVSATGSLLGRSGTGVRALSLGANGGGIAISITEARGGRNGVSVLQEGLGSVSITVAGQAVGGSGTGILLEESRGIGVSIRAGSATGAKAGIRVPHKGRGAVSITATGLVVGSATYGVHALGGPESTGVAVAVATATGGIHGISAVSSGTGETAVSALGAATGRTGDGVQVQTGSSGAGVAVAVASATGAAHGIRVDSNGSGTLTISATGSIRSESQSGVRVRSAAAGGNVIVAVASVEAQSHGIDVDSSGSGTLSISALGRIRSGGTGVHARSRSGGGDVAVSVADVHAGVSGITAQQDGTGKLSVSASKPVVGGDGDGIHAFGGVGAADVSIAAASVTGARRGMDATSSGAGSLTVVASGAVTGLFGEAVRVRTGGSAAGVAVAVASATGATDGISVDANGSGTLSIAASGLASGKAGAGIKVDGSAAITDVIVAAASATGTTHGIDVDVHGSGTLSVTASGSLHGETGTGVRIRKNGSLSGDVEVSTADARGGIDGISVLQASSGTVSITVAGHAVGDSANGILLKNGSSRGNSWIVAGSATGARNGIQAPNAGRGSLSITATGAVVGHSEDGIHAIGGPESTGVSISAATVTGARQGIFASNGGSGTLSVSAAGTVTGERGSGISATEAIRGAGLSIAAASVTGRVSGIVASSLGSATMSVKASGFTRGRTGAGIEARSRAELMINAASATGWTQGIDATNNGSGKLRVSATGSLLGETGAGVRARNYGFDGGDLAIEVVDARGGLAGMLALHWGTGSVSITAAGHAVGDSAEGIAMSNSERSGAVSIHAGSATGATAGIHAPHLGRGNLTISASGTILGSRQDGIEATGSPLTEGIHIAAATVTGGRNGISAWSRGSGTMSVRASGHARGGTGAGLNIRNAATGIGVRAAAASATGGTYGINADNSGSGTLTVSATGSLLGIAGAGIRARNLSQSGGNIVVDVAGARGGVDGVSVLQHGRGSVSITAAGHAIGGSANGILLANTLRSGDVAIHAASATGAKAGIEAPHLGRGALSITATGSVTGSGTDGMHAFGGPESAGVFVVAATVTGARRGIAATGSGTGMLSVSASGSVTGLSDEGIHVRTFGSGAGVVLSAASATGASDGISVDAGGSGTLLVRARGLARGRSGSGLKIRAAASATNVTVAVAAASGAAHGIDANSRGSGTLLVSASGSLVGKTGSGVRASNSSGAGGDLVVSVAEASGEADAVSVTQMGAGSVSVTSTGLVESGSAHGIRIENVQRSGAISIFAGSVTGAQAGIWAPHVGSGTLLVAATGNVEGTALDGIHAHSSASGSGIAVSAARVSGGRHGIWALGAGAGAVSVTATGSVAGAAGTGILARNTPAGSGISIAAASATGSVDGIYAYNRGGALHLTASGHATGAAGAGLRVRNAGAGTNVAIAAASATGAQDGIRAQIAGGEASIFASGAVVGNGGDGVFVLMQDRSSGLALFVSSATGSRDGIHARASGSTAGGAIVIAASGRASGPRFGVFAATGARSTSLTLLVATVTGSASGIHASGSGTGTLSVVATGAVTSTSGTGIDADNSPAGTTLTVSAASVTAARTGIDALQSGTGALFVSASGHVLGRGSQHYGVRAVGGENSTGIAIETVGVSGSLDGIRASSRGSGRVAVSAAGAVVGTAGHGISAFSDLSGTGIAVVASSVTGGMHGILVQSRGSGDVSVTATGAVSGGAGSHGIYASNSSAKARGVAISAAGVSGRVDGIRAVSSGTGAISITASEHVRATGKHGIRAINRAASGVSGLRAGGVSIIAASVTGAEHGIYALGAGAGSISITASGMALGSASDGIHVKNASGESNARPGSVSVSAASATGGSRGIFAANYGTGTLSITATGAVRGIVADGIRAYNSGSGSSLTVSAAAVAGKGRGISARNLGDGKTAVSASGNVVAVGVDGIGIDAHASGTARTMTIRAAAVTGRSYGVLARNYGFGALRIALAGTASGAVRGGIAANNSAYGSDMAISADGATGRAFGVTAHNSGAGALSISLTGPASAISGPGISAVNSEQGTSLSVTATRVSGRNYGILARNLGVGPAAVTATGSVTSLTGEGIHVSGAKAGGGITVSAAAVTGRSYGIRVLGMGAGLVSVTASGTVSSSISEAIHAVGGALSTDLFIRAPEVKGWTSGIVASSTGGGDVTVGATGALTAKGGDGIRAFVGSAGGHVTVGAAAITATAFGVHAHGEGAGSVSVSASGTVSTRIDAGIHAYGAARGGNVTVSAAAVSGGKDGIRARNLGTGAVSVLASGDVTGSGADAIYASNSASGGALTISAGGAVTGRSSGIKAINAGAGKMHVRATGPVSGGGILSGDAGVLAHNTASATELELGLSIAVSSVTAGNDGINALNRGGGNLKISADAVSGERGYGMRAFNYGVGTIGIVASGPVTSGFGQDGIRAHSDSSGTGLSITAGSVSGDRHGIFASSDGSGELSVSVSGSVTGGAGLGYAAIKTQTAEARPVIVEIKSGATIAARNQVAILDGSGTAAVAIRAGSSVSGAISLGADSDELLFAGGDTSGIGRLDGGAGMDTLRFASGTLGIAGGELAFGGYARTASLENWERVSVETGASVSGTIVFGSGSDELILGGGNFSAATSLDGGDGTDTLRISAGAGRLSADILLNWEKVLIDSAGAVSFFGSQTLRTGTLRNAGTLSLDDGAADDALAVTGDFSGGGTLVVNVNFETGTSDTLSVAGDVTGAATGISVLKVAGAGTPSGSAVDIVTVTGEVAESAFELIGGSLAVGSFTYSLDFVESERKFSLTSSIASGEGSGGFAAALHSESPPLEGAGIAIAMLASQDAPPEGAGVAATMLPSKGVPSAATGAAAAMPSGEGVPTAGATAAAPPSESPQPATATAIAMPPGEGTPPAAAAVAALPGERASSIGAATATLPREDAPSEAAGDAAAARNEEGRVRENGREGPAESGRAGAPKAAMRASAANNEANAPPRGEASDPAVENSVQGGPAEIPASAQSSGGSAYGGPGGSASGASAPRPKIADSPESPDPKNPVAQGGAAATDDNRAPSGNGAGTAGKAQARNPNAGTDGGDARNGGGAAAHGGALTERASVQNGTPGDTSPGAGPIENGAQSAPERTDPPDTRTAAGAADGDTAHGGAAQGAGDHSPSDALPSIMRAAPAVLLSAYGRLRPLAERNPNRGSGHDETHVGDRFRIQAYGATENLPKDTSGSAVKASRYGIRGEMDLLELEGGAGNWTFGVTAHHGRVSAESKGTGGAQGLEAAGYDLGAAATWRGASGAYVDLQARYGRIESDIMSKTREALAEGAEFGFGAAGFEIGRRTALNAGMSLTSSAQVSWSGVFGDAFADESGAYVDFGTDTAVKGRLGLAIEFVRGALNGYVSGGILHDFALESDATVNGVSGGEDFRGGAVEIAGGADWRLAEGTGAYIRASHSAGSDDRSGSSVSAGFNWKW